MFGGDKVHGLLANGMSHPEYTGPIPIPNGDPRSIHHSQSTVLVKQEPIGSLRNCTL